MAINKKSPFISIVIINFNGYKYLNETLTAVKKLVYPSYEILVIDNGSTDGSVEFLNNDKKIHFFQSPRISEKNYACNIGISKAKGEFILLLDNDLLITDKNILNNLLSEWNLADSCGCFSLAFSDRDSDRTKGYGCYTSYYYSWEKPEITILQLKKMHRNYVGSPNGAGIFIKKSLWDQIGGYDDHLPFGGDDDDLGMRLWMFGYKNYLYSKTIQIHIGQEERTDTIKYSKKLERKVYAHLYTIVKNFKVWNLIITLSGYTAFSLLKSLKQSLDRKSLKPVASTLSGYYLFLRNLKYALNKRKILQKKRIIKEDIIYKIRPIINK